MQQATHRRPNYFAVFGILAVFTLIETLVSYVQTAAIKLPVLIVLALVKAVLVLLYFMHLRSDSPVFSYLFVAGCVLALPLILGTALVAALPAVRLVLKSSPALVLKEH